MPNGPTSGSTPGSTPWINGRRLRIHGAILALCLWSIYGWNVATPGLLDRNGNLKGTDFSQWYTLGSVGLTHRAVDLYNENAQAEITARRIPAATGIRYIPLYPPQVSIFFAPLATLPYGMALVIWLVLSSLLYGVCCYALWRSCPRLRTEGWTVLILAIAFPGFFHLIAWGQTSALALACFTAAFFLLRDERPFLAGLALGCLMFKPQLGIAAAFVFAYTRAWRVIAGGALSAIAQLAVPALYYGADSLRAWMRIMSGVVSNVAVLEPRPYQTLSLRTFWTMLIPGRALPLALYVLSALTILGWTAAVWRRPALPLALRYSSFLVASVLVAPHLLVYDVAILAPVFLLLSDWALAQPPESTSPMNIVLYLGYLAPLAGSITRWTHVQISVVLMSVLVWMIWVASRRAAIVSQ
ncbi:MAG: glycosyltransferase family 87 protein [Terriglobales bacterium]